MARAKLAGVFALVAALALAQGTFTEWTIPTPNSQPHCVVSDSRGRIWYAAIGANQVGMFDPATEEFRELRPPTPNSGPHGIAVSPGDVIWFTEERAGKIGRVDPVNFEITEYTVPTPNASPHTPIYDGRGAIWFTEQTGNRIGRLNIATGAIEEFVIPTPNSGPYGIIADAQGNAWFCAFGGGSNRIGKVDAQTGQITEYATPTANSGPRRPWIDSRGRIWITENRGNKLALFDPATERFREWDTPTRNGQPYGIVIDRNDVVWYNEFNANTIVRFDPATEQFTVYPSPGRGASIRIVAVDPSNRVWYGENGNSKVGVVAPGNSVVNAASYRTPAEPGAGLAPGTIVVIFGTKIGGADATVTINDVVAPVFFSSADQINAQVPYEAPAGLARFEIRRGALMTHVQWLNLGAVSPGIFSTNLRGDSEGIITHTDFRLVSESAPAQRGEFVVIFCTGLGKTEPPPVTGAPPIAPAETLIRPQVTIGTRLATVSYSGVTPGLLGLYQVNVQVPADAPLGVQPVQIVQDGVASNTVTMVIR